MHCNFNGKRKTFTDGFGLCSPGRWPPEARQDYYENPDLAFHHRLGTLLLDLLSKRVDIRGVAFLLASGKCASCPFSGELLQQGREIVFARLKSVGCQLPVDCVAEGQPFYLCALEAILQQAGDPDALALHSAENSFASGVRLGVNCVRPRVPAVFTAKTHWRNYDHITEQTELRENYITAQEHRDVVQKQFEKEASLGAMMEIGLEQAQKEWGKISVASLGALEKADGSYRVIHDATHGLAVNSKIRVQDQVRSPTASDVRRALQALPNAFFALKGDVSRAHRLVKVDKRDWKHLACRTGVHPDRIWLNKVGTFGVASAAYHWSRFMSGLGRAAYYLWGKLGIMQLVYVDDLLWLVGEKGGIEHVVLVIFFYVLMGLPFSWKKFAGGLMCCWVGFELELAERVLGLSSRRAEWLSKWLHRAVEAREVRVADLRSVLGRLSFACSTLSNFRPFLGPLFAWVSAMGKYERMKLPKLAILVMKFLSRALSGSSRAQQIGNCQGMVQEVFRTDARAEGAEIWIGGWALDHHDRSQCRWFAERLDHQNARWAFTAGESYRAIASLELLATLVAVVLFKPEGRNMLGGCCSAGTDNKGNSHVVQRCMTTKFPLCAFNMELTVQLQKRGVELHLHWLPRLQNVEADQLTNGDFSGFDTARRLRFNLKEFRGEVLADILEQGAELYEEVKTARLRQEERGPVKKARQSESLKNTDPW
jgi:hypothetical protein